MKPSRLPQITTILVMVFFYLPIGVLILNSFNASRFGTTWQGFSLKWYERLLERSDLWTALGNSLRIACIASISGSSRSRFGFTVRRTARGFSAKTRTRAAYPTPPRTSAPAIRVPTRTATRTAIWTATHTSAFLEIRALRDGAGSGIC